MSEENNSEIKLITKRTKEPYKNFINFISNKKTQNIIIILLLLGLIIFGIWIRTLNLDGLKDITTNDWTLGPDLDPFLYLRHANEIISGTLTFPDIMRSAPLGSENYASQSFMPWVIVIIYKITAIFGNDSITYAAIITPIILFSLSLIGLFLFCLFIFKEMKFSKNKAIFASTITSFLYIIAPEILHRTTGGIPEIESLGMAFFWFAFLFFVLAWREKSTNLQIISFSLLSGIFTGMMSWSWGGYRYIYMTFAVTSLIIFLIKKESKIKNITIFSLWLIPAILFEYLKIQNLSSIIYRISDTGISLFVLLVFLIYLICYKIPIIKNKLKFYKLKLTESIVSLCITIILLIIVMIIINPQFIIKLIPDIIENLLYPFGRGRVGSTIAENQVVYLKDILNSFKYLFWSFLVGILFLFYDIIKHFNLKKKIIFYLSFLIFLFGILFSKISSSSILNGDNFISKLVYFGGLILFFGVLIKEYITANIKKDEKYLEDFNKITPAYFLVFVFIFWIIISMKGAIRLLFIISPAILFVSSYLIIKVLEKLKNSKDELKKIILIILFLGLIFLLIYTSISNTKNTIMLSKSTIPSAYNHQWQKAMEWVRENTFEKSIFVHWWDYGYWIQTLGERPTVTDGGHYIGYWDHLTGRYILTTPYPEIALSFMKTYNVSYLLIDPTDIGKYSAYSSIGSDESGKDRLSWIPSMISLPEQITETKNGTIRIYQGATILDEDIIYSLDENELLLPAQKAGILGIILESSEEEGLMQFKQPIGVFTYNGKQIRLPLRYLYIEGQLIDFHEGIESTIKIIPRIYQTTQGYQLDLIGAGIYLSPKVTRSLVGQLYLLDGSLNDYTAFELVHSEEDPTLQGAGLNSFVYFNGILGPIKIWKINYPSNILVNEEFLRTSGEYAEFDNLDFIK